MNGFHTADTARGDQYYLDAISLKKAAVACKCCMKELLFPLNFRTGDHNTYI
jgi:hypothetical protein